MSQTFSEGSESIKMLFCSRSAAVTAQDSLYFGTVHVLVMTSANQHAFMIQTDSNRMLRAEFWGGELKVMSQNRIAKSKFTSYI